jgi:glutamate formiminotransferase
MLIECIPNFSEGRNPGVLDALVGAVRSIPGINFLDLQSDKDHNRCVLTFVGDRGPVSEAVLAAARVAVAQIDLTRHTGEHPRMGAMDVCPFVPIRDCTMDDCVALAKEIGARVGGELKIPVYLYESAATRPDRRNLAEIRKPQFEGLRDLIGTDPDRLPDFGPASIHPTAGCVAIGARPALVAYNIDLQSDLPEAKIAKRIAKKIRERDGGLPGIKALGLYIADRRCEQVSINVCDFTRTSLLAVFEAVEREAAAYTVVVRSSEIVGLVPRAALLPDWVARLKLAGFTPDQVIETKLGL